MRVCIINDKVIQPASQKKFGKSHMTHSHHIKSISYYRFVCELAKLVRQIDWLIDFWDWNSIEKNLTEKLAYQTRAEWVKICFFSIFEKIPPNKTNHLTNNNDVMNILVYFIWEKLKKNQFFQIWLNDSLESCFSLSQTLSLALEESFQLTMDALSLWLVS